MSQTQSNGSDITARPQFGPSLVPPNTGTYSIAETAKANNLKLYEYFEYLLTQIPAHMDDTDRSFLEDLLPWSPKLPEYIRKQKDRG